MPITAVLREHLVDHKLREGGAPEALAFAGENGRPVSGTALPDRALRAWKAAGLDPIAFHECRHTFASVWIAAGVGAKASSTFMGHANIAITLDRYGHLMPGSEEGGSDWSTHTWLDWPRPAADPPVEAQSPDGRARRTKLAFLPFGDPWIRPRESTRPLP